MNITQWLRQHRRRAEYKRYMRSDEWAAIRDVKLSIAAYECEKCGSRDSLHVHHLTYDRFGGDERMTDLQVLCRPCHNQAHGRKF